MKLIATRGVPGSGKTTWAKNYAFFNNAMRVSRDDLRRMLHGQAYDIKHEQIIRSIRTSMIYKLLRAGHDVVVDETLIKKNTETELKAIAKECGADFEIKHFDTPLEVCLQRDAARDRVVGEPIIRRMWNDLNSRLSTKDQRVWNTLS